MIIQSKGNQCPLLMRWIEMWETHRGLLHMLIVLFSKSLKSKLGQLTYIVAEVGIGFFICISGGQVDLKAAFFWYCQLEPPLWDSYTSWMAQSSRVATTKLKKNESYSTLSLILWQPDWKQKGIRLSLLLWCNSKVKGHVWKDHRSQAGWYYLETMSMESRTDKVCCQNMHTKNHSV